MNTLNTGSTEIQINVIFDDSDLNYHHPPICFFVDVLKPLDFAGSVNKWLLSWLPCDLTVAMQQ